MVFYCLDVNKGIRGYLIALNSLFHQPAPSHAAATRHQLSSRNGLPEPLRFHQRQRLV